MTIRKRLFDMARAEQFLARQGVGPGIRRAIPTRICIARYGLRPTDRRATGGRGWSVATRAGPRPRQGHVPPAAPDSGEQRIATQAARPSSDASPASLRPRTKCARLRRAGSSSGFELRDRAQSYRALMRKYHPTIIPISARKAKDRTELTQKLTEAYRVLERKLRNIGRLSARISEPLRTQRERGGHRGHRRPLRLGSVLRRWNFFAAAKIFSQHQNIRHLLRLWRAPLSPLCPRLPSPCRICYRPSCVFATSLTLVATAFWPPRWRPDPPR